MPFDPSYAKKAASILLTKGKQLDTDSLLSNEDSFVYCQVSFMDIPVRANGHDWRSPKQYPLKVTHPIHAGAQVCFITNDESPETKNMLKELFRHPDLQKLGVSVKVLPFPILKRDHAAFEAKRKLSGSFDLFLADDRIIPLLPSRLGKAFFKVQKQPLGIQLYKVQPEAVLKSIKHAVTSTWVTFGHGSTVAFHVGRLNFTAEQIADNCESALSQLAKKPFVGGWKGLQTCLLQAEGIPNIFLPIYRRLPVYVGPSKTEEDQTESSAASSSSASSSSSDQPKKKATKAAAKQPKQKAAVTAGKNNKTESSSTSKQSKPEEEQEPTPKKTARKAAIIAKPIAIAEEAEAEAPAPKKTAATSRSKKSQASSSEPVHEDTVKKTAAKAAASAPTAKKTSKRSKPEPEPESEPVSVVPKKKNAAESVTKVQKTATKVAASSTSKPSKTSKTLDTPKKAQPSSSFSRSKSTGNLPSKKRS